MNVSRPTGNLALPGLRKHYPTTEDEVRENSRLKILRIFPDPLRKHLVAFIGEFVGTFMFLFLAYAGTQIANSQPTAETGVIGSNVSTLLYISLSFGVSLLVNVWIFFRITGGVFNPAVRLGYGINHLAKLTCLLGYPWSLFDRRTAVAERHDHFRCTDRRSHSVCGSRWGSISWRFARFY